MIRRTHQINTDTRELNNSREKQARTNLKQRVLAGLCAFCLVVLQCFVLGTALPEKAYAADPPDFTISLTYKDGTVVTRAVKWSELTDKNKNHQEEKTLKTEDGFKLSTLVEENSALGLALAILIGLGDERTAEKMINDDLCNV